MNSRLALHKLLPPEPNAVHLRSRSPTFFRIIIFKGYLGPSTGLRRTPGACLHSNAFGSEDRLGTLAPSSPKRGAPLHRSEIEGLCGTRPGQRSRQRLPGPNVAPPALNPKLKATVARGRDSGHAQRLPAPDVGSVALDPELETATVARGAAPWSRSAPSSPERGASTALIRK